MQKDNQTHDQKESFSKTIAILRDVLLLLGSISYIIGYIVWSIQAHKHNLGLLPLFDSQYFVTGFLPVLTVSALIALLWGIWIARKFVKNHLDRNAKGWKRFVRFALFAVVTFGSLGTAANWVFRDRLSNLQFVVIGSVSSFLLIVGLTFLPPISLPDSILDKFFPYGSSRKSHQLFRFTVIELWNQLRYGSDSYSQAFTLVLILILMGLALRGISYFVN